MTTKTPSSSTPALWLELTAIMKKGGFWQGIFDSKSPELDRFRQFLRKLSGELPSVSEGTRLAPHFPLFPEIPRVPVYESGEIEAAQKAEAAFRELGEDARSVANGAGYRDYGFDGVPRGQMRTCNFFYLGAPIDFSMSRASRVSEFLFSLPGLCRHYPFGEACFSVLRPGAHLPAHCSTDNFRVRIMLGIDVPQPCGIRVADKTATWEIGGTFVFNDAFEHEAWNESDTERTVFIFDTWHPSLTAVEIAAIQAAFMKSEVRKTFLELNGSGAPVSHASLLKSFEQFDRSDLIRQFWTT